jgi:predicted DNA-binding transcriptional regulator YafY
MKGIPREERLLNLLAALLAARTPLPFREIRRRVSGYDDDASEEAIDKRFDRDKKDLRGIGVPIEYTAEDAYGRAGYHIPRDRYYLDEIRFDHEEGIALAAIERAIGRDEDDPFAASLRSALAKISIDSPLSEAFRESVAEQQLLDPHLPQGADSSLLGDISGALAARCPVRFTYFSLGSGRTADREVEPYGVGYFRGNWYLVGRDCVKKEERVFRTSRIRGKVTVGPSTGYAIPDEFDLSDRLGHPAWEMGEGAAITARVAFRADFAWMIAENLRPGQSFAAEADGGGVLTARVADEPAFIRWVASFGPMAKLLSPPGMVAGIVSYLEDVIERQES